MRNSTYRALAQQLDEAITEQTARRDLRLMVEAGLLVAHGQKRGRFYGAGNDLLDLRRTILAARDPATTPIPSPLPQPDDLTRARDPT